MNAQEEDRMKELLKEALPRMDEEADEGPRSDLWPAVLQRLDAQPAPVPWFDWALVAGLVAFAALFPAAIPIFLYHL